MDTEEVFKPNDIVERSYFNGINSDGVLKAVVVRAFGRGGGIDYRILKGRTLQKSIKMEDDETLWRKVGEYSPAN